MILILFLRPPFCSVLRKSVKLKIRTGTAVSNELKSLISDYHYSFCLYIRLFILDQIMDDWENAREFGVVNNDLYNLFFKKKQKNIPNLTCHLNLPRTLQFAIKRSYNMIFVRLYRKICSTDFSYSLNMRRKTADFLNTVLHHIWCCILKKKNKKQIFSFCCKNASD